MKVLMLSGSPKANGNTAQALKEMEKIFVEEGIEVVTVQVGNQAVRGCIACGGCNTVCPTCSCFDTVDVIYDETTTIIIKGTFHPTHYDTLTGEIKPLSYVHKNGNTVITYPFAVCESLLIKLSDKAEVVKSPATELTLVKEYSIKRPVIHGKNHAITNAITRSFATKGRVCS